MIRLRLAAVLATLVLGAAAFSAAPAMAEGGGDCGSASKPTPTVGS
ncbi:hypothetical protein [Albimonas pacifica]|uniref:Uncharacterized protein n=1 Tax=Albimonas pacifica TaxID=1114924 RepID=A0A1I3I0Z3_9RHOB|nr:hypothetical protein [Albimonas pacifica]SFI41624.1 hypothetical protein SAMN05216258_106282 [Albimonas pacifica]